MLDCLRQSAHCGDRSSILLGSTIQNFSTFSLRKNSRRQQKEKQIRICKETRGVSFFVFALIFLDISCNMILVLSPLVGLKSYIPNKKGAANDRQDDLCWRRREL